MIRCLYVTLSCIYTDTESLFLPLTSVVVGVTAPGFRRQDNLLSCGKQENDPSYMT